MIIRGSNASKTRIDAPGTEGHRGPDFTTLRKKLEKFGFKHVGEKRDRRAWAARDSAHKFRHPNGETIVSVHNDGGARSLYHYHPKKK